MSQPSRIRGTLGARPAFHLVYLLFYFVPWLFARPSATDIAAAVVAIAVFVPIHFQTFRATRHNRVGYLLAIEAIAFAAAPFHGMQGVFHIYACVQAGYTRPERRAAWFMLALTVAYLLLSVTLDLNWYETGFVLFMGAITGISCMAGAEQMARQRTLERSRALDQQLAAIAERERIARDLHDLLGHTLTMVALKAEVANKLFDTDPERARQEIGEIRDASRTALKDVRSAVTGMNVTTIDAEIAHAKEALSAAGVQFSVTGIPPRTDAHQSKTIGLAIREAVTNIVRHSMADKATLSFSHTAEGHVVTIEDNGHNAQVLPGSGLTGLRQRIERLGGRTEISTDTGARITLHLPSAAMKAPQR